MAVIRMDNVAVVVTDLDAAIAFFEALGLALEGRQVVEGPWVDAVVGLDGTRSEIALMATPDGHSRVELTRYHSPAAIPSPAATPNEIGFSRIMFAVDDVDATVARLSELGGSVVREVVDYGDAYRLCYLRGPDGIIVALAQELAGF